MATVQTMKTTLGVSEEVSGLRNNVQDVAAEVEGASNKLDRILHGAPFFYSTIDTLLIVFRLPHFQCRLK
jgi:hypothetical protein